MHLSDPSGLPNVMPGSLHYYRATMLNKINTICYCTTMLDGVQQYCCAQWHGVMVDAIEALW